jgi:hypothetical protein
MGLPRLAPALLLLLTCCPTGLAERAPLSAGRLLAAASHVITAKVTAIEIRDEPSTVERGLGNRDAGVYCSLLIKTVEKGKGLQPGDTIIVRCFVASQRRSCFESIGLAGHDPIPRPGQIVRVHLEEGLPYSVVYPNGFTPASRQPIAEAEQIHKLRHQGPRFSFLLPLEAWALLVGVGFLILGVVWFARLLRR